MHNLSDRMYVGENPGDAVEVDTNMIYLGVYIYDRNIQNGLGMPHYKHNPLTNSVTSNSAQVSALMAAVTLTQSFR